MYLLIHISFYRLVWTSQSGLKLINFQKSRKNLQIIKQKNWETEGQNKSRNKRRKLVWYKLKKRNSLPNIASEKIGESKY